MNNTNEDASAHDLELQSDHSSDYLAQPQPRRLRGFAATAAGANSTGRGKKEREKEKERTKLRERHRRAITSRMLAGLRQYGNFPLPARADINDVLAALAREAGWIVNADGTTYRQCLPPSHKGPFAAKSVDSQVSGGSLRTCSVKETLDNQPPVLRIDECLSPASIDSVVIVERDSNNRKYASVSPINSADCLEADQLMQDIHSGVHESDFNCTPYVPVYIKLPAGLINKFCQLMDPEGIRCTGKDTAWGYTLAKS